MIDIEGSSTKILNFYSDASKAICLGFGAWFNDRWIFGQWPEGFINNCDPSIEFLELYALVAGIFTWEESLQNMRITVFCDNKATIQMVNNTTSSCVQCMKLIRLLTLNCLKYNRRVRAKFVSTKDNAIADALSRLQFDWFNRLEPNMRQKPDYVDDRLNPVTKIWFMGHA